jgi:hypothetical protein
MTRILFQTTQDYNGRLSKVFERHIENSASVKLLRLEFEVFLIITPGKEMHYRGKACRDLLVGLPNPDDGLTRYARCLGIKDESDPHEWLAAPNQMRWVTIWFGDPLDMDNRQPFLRIERLRNPNDWKIGSSSSLCEEAWVSIGNAAECFSVSASTVRRKIGDLEPEFGERLVRYTGGSHRRINLHLLRHIWSSD